jgi:hypothetical protein
MVEWLHVRRLSGRMYGWRLDAWVPKRMVGWLGGWLAGWMVGGKINSLDGVMVAW